jgi:hypothetical protein
LRCNFFLSLNSPLSTALHEVYKGMQNQRDTGNTEIIKLVLHK